MKMISINKLHASPVTLNFIKASQKGLVYADDYHFLYFDCNSLIIDGYGTILHIDNIFMLIRATLRKYKCKHFQKLHLYFNDCNMLDRTILNCLGLEIAAHFRNLREFTIQFFLCENLTDDDLNTFLVPLTTVLKNVTKLTINIICCEKFGDEGMSLLSSLLRRRFTNLKKLTLNLSEKQTQNGYEDNVPYNLDILSQIYERRTYDAAVAKFYDSGVTSNGVSLLCRSLTKYLSRNLSQLSLILPECGEPEEEFENCSIRKNIIPTLRGLKKLNLHLYTFIDDMEVPKEDIVEIALNIGQYLCKLEYLTLDFSMLHQFDLATVASNIFPNLSDLKGLIMSYDNSRNVLDNQLTSFTTEMFKYMKKLEELAFCFRQYSEITNKAVQNIIENINQDLHSLKKLTLDFRSPGIDAENIQLLSNTSAQSLEELNLYVYNPKLGINNHFVNLKKLTLLFYDCSEMTDSEFAEITHNLFSCSLTGLKELSLFFCDAKKITDGVEALWSKNWAQLANLKVFALEFSQCRNISDVTLGLAGSCFQKNMKNLQSLMLIFSGSDYITTRGIEFLIKSICKHLRNLENLHLNAFAHERVESKKREFIEEIGDQIANRLKKLKELRLDLDIHHACFEYEDNLALFRSLRKKMSFIRKLVLN